MPFKARKANLMFGYLFSIDLIFIGEVVDVWRLSSSTGHFSFVSLYLQCVTVQWREHDAALQPGCVFRSQPGQRSWRWWRGVAAACHQRRDQEHHPAAWEHLPQPEWSSRTGVWEMHDTRTGWLVGTFKTVSWKSSWCKWTHCVAGCDYLWVFSQQWVYYWGRARTREQS